MNRCSLPDPPLVLLSAYAGPLRLRTENGPFGGSARAPSEVPSGVFSVTREDAYVETRRQLQWNTGFPGRMGLF